VNSAVFQDCCQGKQPNMLKPSYLGARGYEAAGNVEITIFGFLVAHH